MSGVIDKTGQQWERCNGCGEYVTIESMKYEQPSTDHQYGRDLCPGCAPNDPPAPPIALIPRLDPNTTCDECGGHEVQRIRTAAVDESWDDAKRRWVEVHTSIYKAHTHICRNTRCGHTWYTPKK